MASSLPGSRRESNGEDIAPFAMSSDKKIRGRGLSVDGTSKE